MTRVEYFENGVVVRAEEDTDGDGRIDKWEAYAGPCLAMVSFDTRHKGVADRRLVYEAGGAVRVEIDARGDGRFGPISPARVANTHSIQ